MRDLEHARAFSPQFADVAELNAKVSDQLLRLVDRARQSGVAAASLLILGPAGAGKTHLFERMRRKLGPEATFIYLRPEIGSESSFRHVLMTVLDSLKQPVAGRDYTQLDVVVGAALATAEQDNPRFPTTFLEKIRELPTTQRDAVLDRAEEFFESRDPGLDADWLNLLLKVPFLERGPRRAALAWLSAREPSDADLASIGRSGPLSDLRLKSALRSLATMTAAPAPLVVVFDQLENLVESDGRVDRIRAHARLYSETFDECKGMVLVQMALDGEWAQRIRPQLGPSELSRLESNVQQLELPNAAQHDKLLASWRALITSDDVALGPTPAPFSVAAWDTIRGRPGLTPRMLFTAARQALEDAAHAATEPPVRTPAPVLSPIDRALERHWAGAQSEVRDELIMCRLEERGVDDGRLGAAIHAVVSLLPETKVTLGQGRAPRETLRVKRFGAETVVYVVQSMASKTVLAQLQEAVKTTATHPVVVIRESSLPLPSSWKVTNEAMEQLAARDNARVLWPSPDDIVDALAVHDLLTAARSGDIPGPDGSSLDEATVTSWIQRALKPAQLLLALALA